MDSPAIFIFIAALTSLSNTNPHALQSYNLFQRGMSCLFPHEEQSLLEANHFPVLTKCFPCQSHLYSKNVENVPHPASAIDRASFPFFSIPLMFRSSTHTTPWFLDNSVDNLCK